MYFELYPVEPKARQRKVLHCGMALQAEPRAQAEAQDVTGEEDQFGPMLVSRLEVSPPNLLGCADKEVPMVC